MLAPRATLGVWTTTLTTAECWAVKSRSAAIRPKTCASTGEESSIRTWMLTPLVGELRHLRKSAHKKKTIGYRGPSFVASGCFPRSHLRTTQCNQNRFPKGTSGPQGSLGFVLITMMDLKAQMSLIRTPCTFLETTGLEPVASCVQNMRSTN